MLQPKVGWMEYHARPVLYFILSLILVFAASLIGGLVPLWGRLTHRGMQVTLSFVAGIMVSVSLFDLLPHAFHMHGHGEGGLEASIIPVLLWVVAGFLGIFLLERFICFHHHDAPSEESDHSHCHETTWVGALVGLCIHGLLAGIAMGGAWGAGESAWLGILLAIMLHKPFDGLALVTLMHSAGQTRARCLLFNLAYALVTPVGAIIGHVGIGGESAMAGASLAFAAGLFLCIALSDLLPELQFHRHDRLLLSFALVLGLSLGWASSVVVDHGHDHGVIEEHDHDHAEEGHEHSMLLREVGLNRSKSG